ncbi:hypothetical protein [Nodosilinea sp. E11]|uniref:hypothetical protein n=1 Tax=Nodosilinea sp. E11 TaxID=3037479 RepID=UPI0029342AD8|nr:hypothetical protein [Nodosilinea sp. E11]WOD38163.1 hypothetical protein RRF56_18285 [Nodosilinea sp. E11]
MKIWSFGLVFPALILTATTVLAQAPRAAGLELPSTFNAYGMYSFDVEPGAVAVDVFHASPLFLGNTAY